MSTTMTTDDYDVAIIGYGPSGVVAANTLGALGVRAVAFERNPDVYGRARAVTVSDWTMRIFQSLGLAEQAKADMDPTVALRWVTYDGQELLRLPFPPGDLGHATSYAIYQPALERTLRGGAARYPNVEVRYGVEVCGIEQDDAGVVVTTRDLDSGEQRRTRAAYALGCYGGEQSTRELLGVDLVGDTLQQRWIIIDGKVKRWWPNRHILTFWSDRVRPVVDIALGRDNHRWEIPLAPGETDADYASEDAVWPLLESLGVSRDDIDIHGWAFYSHHIRHAEQWRLGRVLLTGDAAHLMPPWAGAGMQSGIRDAFNASWKLAEVLAGRLPESVLDTYQQEREPNVAFYTGVAVQLGRIITQDLTEEEQAALAEQSDELPPLLWPPTYPAGWLRGVDAPEGFPLGAVGRMLPQPRVADTRGLIGPLDELLGLGFVLLGDGVDPASLLTAEERAGWDRLGAAYRAVRSPEERSEAPEDLIDIDGRLREWMRGLGVRVVAVRPDRFVAAADTTGLAVPA